jgi:hypothetical protein
LTTYYTYKRDVPLLPGQTLGFTPGRGYYAHGTPTPTQATRNTTAYREPKTPPPTPPAPKAVPPPVISEHGQGGGSGASDTGRKPTQQEAHGGNAQPAVKQPTAAVTPSPILSEHGRGGGTGTSDSDTKPIGRQMTIGYRPSPRSRAIGVSNDVDRMILSVDNARDQDQAILLSTKHKPSPVAAAAVRRLPKWMLHAGSPPRSATETGVLPRVLSVAANPAWRTAAGREHFAFEYLKHALDLTKTAAAALVGNMAVESRSRRGANLNPGIWQTGTPASTHTMTSPSSGFGIAQWTVPARKEALADFAGKLPVGNFAVELAFVAHELNHTYPKPLIQPDTLPELRKAKSLQEATAIVMAAYEHPETYLQVPAFSSVVHLLGEWSQGRPLGADPRDSSGYVARLQAARKIEQAYG